MGYFMGRRIDNGSASVLPPRIKAAFDFLDYARMITTQYDATVPVRNLTPMEKSVEQASLRALQQYLLGEMDFAENTPASKPTKRDDEEDGTAPARNGCTT
jgi:hypothetical protein